MGILSGIYHFTKNSPISYKKCIMVNFLNFKKKIIILNIINQVCAPSNAAIDEIITRIK